MASRTLIAVVVALAVFLAVGLVYARKRR